ncbi:MAG TPA: flagellar hook-basal body complex protein FliE [Stellaceae bacterium]|jgi:flagellar hook-basal body complex protein FliE|nr:flagellar hook-basal body complex protein FliE [Stellaceae bacterium]
MVASIASAAAAYANAGRIGGAVSAAPGGGGFADLLQQAAGDAVGALKTGEAESLNAVTTGKADLTKVTEAVNNAEIALQTVIAVRDKVIAAYQAISSMPI